MFFLSCIPTPVHTPDAHVICLINDVGRVMRVFNDLEGAAQWLHIWLVISVHIFKRIMKFLNSMSVTFVELFPRCPIKYSQNRVSASLRKITSSIEPPSSGKIKGEGVRPSGVCGIILIYRGKVFSHYIGSFLDYHDPIVIV